MDFHLIVSCSTLVKVSFTLICYNTAYTSVVSVAMLTLYILSTCLLPFCVAEEFKAPERWLDSRCTEREFLLDKGRKPSPYATFADEFDKENRNYFFKQNARRVYYGETNSDNGYPWTSICNIMQRNDAHHWCTCLILTNIFVLTDRLCFRDRSFNKLPTAELPDIKITYGTTSKSSHTHVRDVVAMYNHPNYLVHASLFRLNETILFTAHLQPFSPDRWIKTTGWRNLIPTCSTLMCGYVSTNLIVSSF